MNSSKTVNTLKILAFLAIGTAFAALSGCEVSNSAPVGDGENSALLVDVETAVPVTSYAVQRGFEANRIRPMEFGGDMGTRAVTDEVVAQIHAR